MDGIISVRVKGPVQVSCNFNPNWLSLFSNVSFVHLLRNKAKSLYPLTNLFLKMPAASFSFILVPSSNMFLYEIKYPCSSCYRDSNSWPLDYESPQITTRPGLQALFYMSELELCKRGYFAWPNVTRSWVRTWRINSKFIILTHSYYWYNSFVPIHQPSSKIFRTTFRETTVSGGQNSSFCRQTGWTSQSSQTSEILQVSENIILLTNSLIKLKWIELVAFIYWN